MQAKSGRATALSRGTGGRWRSWLEFQNRAEVLPRIMQEAFRSLTHETSYSLAAGARRESQKAVSCRNPRQIPTVDFSYWLTGLLDRLRRHPG